MSRTLPEGCPRGLDCQPLHRIQSDDEATFVCCGLHGAVDRVHGTIGEDDPYRLCFKTDNTDTMYDYDEADLMDEVEVIVRGLSTARRLVTEIPVA